MPTPPTVTFDDGLGTILDLNDGIEYKFLQFGQGWSQPPLTLDVIRRTQRSGVNIPYVSIAEREAGLIIRVRGRTRAETQERYNRLLQHAFITDGGNEPIWGELRLGLWDDVTYAARCAIKGAEPQLIGLTIQAQLMFTMESGLLYNPVRTVVPAASLSVGADLPVLGKSTASPGDALPWEMGGGYPAVDVMIPYDGTARSYSLEAIITGPSVRPLIRRGNLKFEVNDTVPEGTQLFIAMDGPRAELQDLSGNLLADWTGRRTGDSFALPLITGANTFELSQRNAIDGAYNTVSYSYRVEYISTGA